MHIVVQKVENISPSKIRNGIAGWEPLLRYFHQILPSRGAGRTHNGTSYTYFRVLFLRAKEALAQTFRIATRSEREAIVRNVVVARSERRLGPLHKRNNTLGGTAALDSIQSATTRAHIVRDRTCSIA